MKIKKYGCFEFGGKRDLNFAVMVDCGENGYNFVTKTNNETKTWEAENGKQAKLFDNRYVAQNLALSICYNGVYAYVVEVIFPELRNKKVDNETEIK